MQGPAFRPSHAYLPGLTRRHEEGAFDDLRATARAGMSPEALSRCDAFVAGLQLIDEGFFWEAHEVLEPVWMALDEGSAERRLVQGLIQIANGELKAAMGRPKAALRLSRIARGLIPARGSGSLMRLDPEALHGRIDRLELHASNAL